MHGPITTVSWAQKSNYSGPLNNTGLNCVSSLICWSFSINSINVFSLDFLINSSLSLAYFKNIVYNTIDPWTTLVWTVRIHLTWIFSNWPLFNSPLQFKSMSFIGLFQGQLQCWESMYTKRWLQLYLDFPLHRRLAPLHSSRINRTYDIQNMSIHCLC